MVGRMNSEDASYMKTKEKCLNNRIITTIEQLKIYLFYDLSKPKT